MSRLLLAIETSCDETAVTLFDALSYFEGKELNKCILSEQLATSAELHQAYGGVVPELAAREQTVALPPLVERALSNYKTEEIFAVAATAGPGLNGSLLVGLSYAKGLAYGKGAPLVLINHLEGHLASHELLPAPQRLRAPYVTLLVSGGHSEVILLNQDGSLKTLARTRDDAAGEAFDKSATLLGLPYPGGPALSKIAELGDKSRFDFPIGVAEDPGSFSFSGLKTAVLRQVQSLPSPLSEKDKCDLAASIQNAIIRALVSKTIPLAKATEGVFLTGGVAANQALRKELENSCKDAGLKFAAADVKYCTDNATMIGAAALTRVRRSRGEFENWKPHLGNELGPGVGFDATTRTTWFVD